MQVFFTLLCFYICLLSIIDDSMTVFIFTLPTFQTPILNYGRPKQQSMVATYFHPFCLKHLESFSNLHQLKHVLYQSQTTLLLTLYINNLKPCSTSSKDYYAFYVSSLYSLMFLCVSLLLHLGTLLFAWILTK
jgi:hypothetical protein